MNAINRALTGFFDLVLRPLEALGMETALTLVSGIFGVLALVVFKRISSQRGIKATKDKIKGHMIEIRLYQDDLGLVTRAIGKVLLRNFQYLALNFGPFLPLAVPFSFVVAQMVVRYAFDPVATSNAAPAEVLAGSGTTLKIELDAQHAARAGDLEVVLPAGLVPVSRLAAVKGFVAQEFIANAPGDYEILLRIDGREYTKKFHARDPQAPATRPRHLQPERAQGFWSALLWPAEDNIDAGSPIRRVSFGYPESDLGWLPLSGPGGVIVWFLIASMAFGLVMLKPLGVQI